MLTHVFAVDVFAVDTPVVDGVDIVVFDETAVDMEQVVCDTELMMWFGGVYLGGGVGIRFGTSVGFSVGDSGGTC